MQNLRLPLCPKCGNTKHVSSKSIRTLEVKLCPVYRCEHCNVEWDENMIADENGIHRFHNTTLTSPNFEYEKTILRAVFPDGRKVDLFRG